MCIKETLRRVPTVPIISREIANPLTVEGVTLLTGTMVVIGVFEMHHNATVWGDDHMVRLAGLEFASHRSFLARSFIYSFSHGTTVTSKQSNDNITK